MGYCSTGIDANHTGIVSDVWLLKTTPPGIVAGSLRCRLEILDAGVRVASVFCEEWRSYCAA